MDRSIDAGFGMPSHHDTGGREAGNQPDEPARRPGEPGHRPSEDRREPEGAMAGLLRSAKSYVNPWAECWGPCRGTARSTSPDRTPMTDTPIGDPAGTQAPTPQDPPASAQSIAPGTLIRVLPVINNKGLHARASAKFVQTVEGFEADVTVTRGGETVGGRSIMGLMMLAAARGTTITVETRGPQAEAAMAAIEALLASRFGEEC